MATRISKAFRGKKHVGWKKTIGGREWFLGYGITPAAESQAKELAEVLDAKWKLAKVAGRTQLSASDLDEAKALLSGQPLWASAKQDVKSLVQIADQTAAAELPGSHNHAVQTTTCLPRWLFAAIEEFTSSIRPLIKPDLSNADHIINTIERINRARDAVKDMPLDALRQKQIEDWLAGIRNLPSKQTGRPLSATTIRNLATAVKAGLAKFSKWEWWQPPPDWRDAFKGYTIKKLSTTSERRKRRKRPPIHSVAEKRLIWHLAMDFEKAVIALADWAGHTQKEIATLLFEDIQDDGRGMYVDRDRNKTGVNGRWWIPPEAAHYIRKVIAQTPRDPAINPNGLAFLTPANFPLVHRAAGGKQSRSDYVGSCIWSRILRASKAYDVQHISFKGLRKATSQVIRDKRGKEVSRTFLAHADEDIQDEHYTQASIEKVQHVIREIYQEWKSMFTPIQVNDWPEVRRQIRLARGLPVAEQSAA